MSTQGERLKAIADAIRQMDGTSEEWADRYPWVRIPGAKMIITTGLMNGGTAMEFSSTAALYKAQGAAIADGMTDEEVLKAIEEFEDNPPGANEPSNEERIAAALEAQVMMAESDAVMAYSLKDESEAGKPSPALERIKRNVRRGLWGPALVQLAVQKGRITQAEGEALLDGTPAK